MKNRFLANAPLFAVLSEEERELMAEHLTLQQFTDGSFLFKQGEAAKAMFLVKSGVVGLVRRNRASDSNEVIGTFGPSSLLGEIDLLLARPYSQTAIARASVDTWMLSGEGLAKVIGDQPEISIKLSSFLGTRIADVDGYLIDRLRKISILSELDDQSLLALVKALELQDIKRGALIFQAGTKANHLYFVENGTISIVSTEVDEPEPFRELGAGEVFGHEALLRHRDYGAVARAATDAQLWLISRHEFERIASQHPSLRQALAAHLNQHALTLADREAAALALAEVPIFEGLSDELLNLIVERMTLRHVGSNETIYKAGDGGDAFYLVDQGVIKLMEQDKLVARKEKGHYFGELALLTGESRLLTARATRTSNLWMLLKQDFDALAVRYPELITGISRALAKLRDEPQASEQINISIFPLFTGLTPKEQADVVRRTRVMKIEANELVFRLGSVPDAFYLLKGGLIRLVSQQGLFDLVRPGGFFGEMSLLTGNTHHVTAQALQDSEVLLLDRIQFDAVMRRYATVSLVLSRALSARLRRAYEHGGSPAINQKATGPLLLPPADVRALTMAKGADPLISPAPRPYSAWARLKFVLVLLPLLWLTGIVGPTMLFQSASDNPDSPLHELIQIIISPTPTPIPTATSESTAEATATAEPSATAEATQSATPTARPTRTSQATRTARPTSTPDPTDILDEE
jgi:CRP-like cAMP-binding protein